MSPIDNAHIGPDGHGPRPQDVLTPRELEILSLIAMGLTNREIADRLGISHNTVKTHVGHILEKLGLRNRTEAVSRHLRG
jgi:DNA-binding NarL/FixJ family response regulator